MDIKEAIKIDKWCARESKDFVIKWISDYGCFMDDQGHTVYLDKEDILAEDWYITDKKHNYNYFL